MHFVLGRGFDALARLLPGGEYNTGLWIPQGRCANDEVIGPVSQGVRLASATLARSNEPINPRKDTVGACMASCAG